MDGAPAITAPAVTDLINSRRPRPFTATVTHPFFRFALVTENDRKIVSQAGSSIVFHARPLHACNPEQDGLGRRRTGRADHFYGDDRNLGSGVLPLTGPDHRR